MIEKVIVFLFSWFLFTLVFGVAACLIFSDRSVVQQSFFLWMKPTDIAICVRGLSILGALKMVIDE